MKEFPVTVGFMSHPVGKLMLTEDIVTSIEKDPTGINFSVAWAKNGVDDSNRLIELSILLPLTKDDEPWA